jgi:UDP-glucose:(heptosyl)LPS alpha-1,3-glucosyltransferase
MNLFGGAERYLSSLLNLLKRENHEIFLITSEWEEIPEVEIVQIDIHAGSSLFSTLEFNRRASEALRSISPDCSISLERTPGTDIYRAGDGCHRRWLQIRRKLEGRLKGLSFHLSPLHRSLLGIEERIFLQTPRIIANSRMVKRDILEYYPVDEDRVDVIYNGVDIDTFSPGDGSERKDLRDRFGIPEDLPIILFMGSDFRRKGLGVLIAALPEIEVEASLLVIGRGDTERYAGLASRYGVQDRVVFGGPVRDPRHFYRGADLFVLPTFYDPFSNATIEALASGLPVVTTSHNGASEIIKDGTDGYLVTDPFSQQELAELISRALENLPLLRSEARKTAERYPLRNSLKKFLVVIQELSENKT